MTESLFAVFWVAAREGSEVSLLLLLIDSYLVSENRLDLRRAALYGVLCSLLVALPAGYLLLDPDMGHRRVWTFWSLVANSLLFFGSPFLIGRRLPETPTLARFVLWILGATLTFFESGALVSVAKGTGLSVGTMGGALATSLGGFTLGLLPFFGLTRWLMPRINSKDLWSFASLALCLGTVRLLTGGMDEFYEQNLVIGLQLGLGQWLESTVHDIRSILLIPPHPYIAMPLSGLMSYLGGDRVSMSLLLAIVFSPPVWILARLVAAPDPEVGHIRIGAERRMRMALFRQDIVRRGSPMMFGFLVILYLVHAANLTLNPLLDPKPVPVQPEEASEIIRIPLADASGDFSDRKIRKYVYYYGDRKIIFLAMERPDGAVATALDECEICRPAAWNTKAIGYAQRGENLVCKYCVTPISAHSFGEPGGCNPIPFESEFDEQYLYVPLKNLIGAWNAAQKIEKAGTHF